MPNYEYKAKAMRNDSPPTLSDVARLARVGTTTVSRVINGGARVSPKTLERVREVIRQLGYSPNHAAQTLKGGRTKTIGLVIPSIADSFFATCTEAAQLVAGQNSCLLIVTASRNDPNLELESLRALVRQRVDGLLLAPANSKSDLLAEFLAKCPIPVVTFDRPVHNTTVPSVVADNYEGARAATQHLIDHGYKRILCLGGEPALYTIQERIHGYRAAVSAAKLPALVDMTVNDYKSAEYAIESQFVASMRPDAVFTLKNSTTISVFETLQKQRIAIPGTLALLGFDDFELASTLRPAISVVQQPIEELGRVAAELLFEQVFGTKKARSKLGSELAPRRAQPRCKQIKLKTRLLLRGSCGCTVE